VCNGSAHAEGYTDSKGYFGITLGQEQGVLQDASETTGRLGGMAGAGGSTMGGGSSSPTAGSGAIHTSGLDTRYNSCDLQAKLPGYRSQLVSLATRRSMDNPDIGVILLHRIGASEGSTISAVSLAAPKEATKAYDKGMTLLRKQKPGDAMKQFQDAVGLYPDYAAAWYELGRLELAQGDDFTARGSFQTAVKADPKFLYPYLELSLLAVQSKKWQEVADVTDRAIALDPFDYPQSYYFNGVANYNLRKIDAAEKSTKEAVRLDTQHRFPATAHLMGLILARRHDYAGAAEQFRNYLQLSPDAEDAATVRQQLESAEKAAAIKAEVKDQ